MASSRSAWRPFAIVAATISVALLGSAAQAAATVGRTAAVSPSPTAAWISDTAEHLSGQKLVVVCATNAPEWRQTLATVGLPPGLADRVYGFSLIQRSEMYLSPYVCEGLRLGRVPSTRRQNELQVSWSVDVLIHESIHIGRATTDEALTEACARTGLPIALHRIYGLAYRTPELARLSQAATWFRRTQGDAYQGGTCAPPTAP